MYQFKSFLKKGIKHGILEKGEENKIPEEKKVVFPEQIHGKNVYICQKENRGEIKNVDGLITRFKDQLLIIKTADCIPLFLYDYSKEKIGLVHAGFKGLIKGIVKEAIENGDFNKEKLLIGIGPHIRKDCYYLRGKNKKYAEMERYKRYTYRTDNKIYFSITELAKDLLKKEGVLKSNINDCGICTYCSDKFFSARKQGKDFNCFKSFIKLK